MSGPSVGCCAAINLQLLTLPYVPQEELANPMYARSAQEWFNKLPDDTAKSIVNLR